MRRAARIGIGFALVAALASPGAAGTEDELPHTRLVAGSHGQTGKRDIAWCWGGPLCTAQTGPIWQGAKRAPAGADAQIRILFSGRPESLTLRGWREIACGIDSCWGTRGRRVYHLGLRRIRRDGDVIGWSAIFNLNDRSGHLYLLLRGRWDATHFATWTFHLDLR